MKASVLLLAMSPGLACAADSSDSLDQLVGIWVGADRASQSIYGTLTITRSTIAWNPENAYNTACEATYALVAESTGTTFPDQVEILSAKAQHPNYKTYKLKLEALPCTNGAAYLQFSLPDNSSYAYVVQYDRHNKPEAWIHFYRRRK